MPICFACCESSNCGRRPQGAVRSSDRGEGTDDSRGSGAAGRRGAEVSGERAQEGGPPTKPAAGVGAPQIVCDPPRTVTKWRDTPNMVTSAVLVSVVSGDVMCAPVVM